MIKLVLFDLGKVLIDFDFKIALEKLRQRCSLNWIKVHSLFRDSRLAEEWDKGLLAPEEFFATIQKELKLPLDMEEFKAIWNGIFAEKKDMIDLALSLTKKKKVVILSNTNPWHADYLRKNFFWLRSFQGMIASCDVKLMKPDPAIYRKALELASVEPAETLYIDDIPEFVKVGRQLGMDAILFKGHSQLLEDLKSRNLP
jgi:putative hydrolase of the HAD superfamily